MINKKVVAEFLNRSMDNHEWLKDLSKKELLKEFESEIRGIKGFKELWVHQLVCLLLIDTFKRFMLHLDMGGGKTSVTLFSILARKMRGEKPRAVVFVPYVTAVDTWVEECKKRTPQLRLVPLIGTTIDNRRLLEEGNGDIFVICYASAVAMLSVPNPNGKGWTIKPDDTRKVFRDYNTFVADEIHKCSNISSLTYRMCRAINKSKRCTHAIGLSGTPFGKDPIDLWGQFYLIDFGETLGETKGLYEEAFFNRKDKFDKNFIRYSKIKNKNKMRFASELEFEKRKMPLLRKMVKHNSVSYASKEMHDLPPQRYIQRKLRLPADIEEYVKIASFKFKKAAKEGNKQDAEMTYLQLRQLASGFLSVDAGGSKVKVAFDENPKLDLLEEYLDAMPPDSKMVIFHHFVYTNELISKRLTKLKIGHARIWSGQRDVLRELGRYRDVPSCRCLVLNDQSGSSALNLQHANYMFFFEQPDSPINRQQGEYRIWRPGQTRSVIYIDPFMEGTVDERIHYSNKQGKRLLDQLLKGKEKL